MKNTNPFNGSLVNYIPHLLDVARLGDSLSPANLLVQFEVILTGGTRISCQPTTLKQLYCLDFTTLDYRCRDLSTDTAAIRQWLRGVIQDQVDRLAPEAGTYFPTTGWHILNGEHVYLAGGSLIGPTGFLPPGSYKTTAALEGLRLAVDEDLSEKTALAEWFTVTFNRGAPRSQPEGISLLSTSAAIFEELLPWKDCTRLVDDLYPSASRTAKRTRDEKANQIIRLVGNSGVREWGRFGATDSIACGIVFTGEYLPEGFSTLVRCLILQLDRPLPSRQLTALQQQPLARPTIIYRFLRWVSAHYYEVETKFRQGMEKLRDARGTTSVQETRLREITSLLLVAMNIFLRFFADSFPSFGKKVRIGIKGMMQDAVFQAINRQKELLAREREHSDTNRFSRCLADLYLSRCGIVITKKPGRKFQTGEAAVEYKGCLCLRSEYLLQLMQRHFRDSGITVKAITSELRRNHLLNMDKSQKSSKKLHQVRALFIRLEDLCAYQSSEDFAAVDAQAAALGLPIPRHK